MKQTSKLIVLPEQIAKTPRHLGINVEVLDYHDSCNIWDWIADSNVSVVRIFHPEVNLRRRSFGEKEFGDVQTSEQFDSFRQAIMANPETGIRWSDYRFAEHVPWLGVPDAIADKLREIGVEPLFSLGYGTSMYPKPLVLDLSHTGIPTDDQLEWGAVASAYEYFFAVIYRYASRFGGRYFMMCNEPENRWGWFHLPEELEGLGDRRWWRLYFEEGAELGRHYVDVLATQYSVLARFARLALEDVRRLLENAPNCASPVSIRSD